MNWNNLKRKRSTSLKNLCKTPLKKSILTTMAFTKSMMKSLKRSRTFALSISQSMKNILLIIRPSLRILRDSRSNGFKCLLSHKSSIKQDFTPLRLGSKKTSRAKWEKLISWRKPSKSLFTPSSNLRFLVLKHLLVVPWANMKLVVVKAIED
jgi:hypothetical protein